ncbi:MAG TPA: FkbM family methyltransferase [Thiobacillaceae bacterium]|nr:FkbM family methyltransferase [Thiobacillaceae bacterium]HNU64066.1 FkbM family methyltransferase [Thiobacillaceae bacterium]
MSKQSNKYLRRIENLGFFNFVRYLMHRNTGWPRTGEFNLYSRQVMSPLVCRGGSSDIDVFKHIFVLREYDAIGQLPSSGLVIDCGANVGFSSAYFLSACAHVHVIAVEPDPGNFHMLRRNTAAFGDRCTCIQAGVWSEAGGLRVVDAPRGDGREWARGVEIVPPGEPADIQAVTIDMLLDRSAFERVALLKVDIEGAEQAVFGHGAEAWLDRVDRIAIELHGERCAEIYRQAVVSAGFESADAGGLTLSWRPGLA